ncbi:MAG TPA: hypothetical protein VES19_16120 [Candidatus Limnocylindrales bacterium]|nr:hypothetical protein [Candidatus Limnocylindrales bacterium]
MPRPTIPPAVPAVRLVAVALASVLAVAACGAGTTNPGWSVAVPSPATSGASGAAGASSGPSSPSVIPVIIGQQEKGPARFVFSFLDSAGNLPAASPERTAQIAFIAPGSTEPGVAVKAEFVWAIEGSRGEYVAYTEFPQAGDWKAIFVTQLADGPQEAIGVAFQVQEELPVIDIGEKAPASKTPTASDVGGDLKQISTDLNPEPGFYELSVSDAIAAGTPFVLVFATPAFCQSAQCGPTLERVKQAAAEAPDDIAFINVEPYQMTFTEGRLQPVFDADNQLQSVASVDEWGILSEPWIFAVDGDGIVRGSFEGIATDQELADAFKAISGT